MGGDTGQILVDLFNRTRKLQWVGHTLRRVELTSREFLKRADVLRRGVRAVPPMSVESFLCWFVLLCSLTHCVLLSCRYVPLFVPEFGDAHCRS